MSNHDAVIDRILEEISGTAADRRVLEHALTHRSWMNESARTGGLPDEANERLEFLGDAVLGLVVAERLLRQFPEADEGVLSKAKARLVSAPVLARQARALGLGPALRLGRGEERTGGRERPSLLADALEAVLGAIFQTRGWTATRAFILRRWEPEMPTSAGDAAAQDSKSVLQEACQRLTGELPRYQVDAVTGPDHNRSYQVSVIAAGRVRGVGRGPSKKEAARLAAAQALRSLQAESASSGRRVSSRRRATTGSTQSGSAPRARVETDRSTREDA